MPEFPNLVEFRYFSYGLVFLSEGTILNLALDLSHKNVRVRTKMIINILRAVLLNRSKILFCISLHSGPKSGQCGYWWCDFDDFCCFCNHCQCNNYCNLHQEKDEITNKRFTDR
mgnify:CR=1 FL=1